MSDTILSLSDLACRYDGRLVVDGLEMRVERGSIVCLLGPSGCGKTTVLRAIAGFHNLTRGEIRLGDAPVSRPDFTLPPEQRRLGMVFQDYALFPHLTVADNVAFGLRDGSGAQKQALAREFIDIVGLTGFERRYPHELSGGQQQRVALARALAPRPQLILLDEPFSNLDVDLRERLSEEVRMILERQGMTAVLVTHDQHEAFALGDQIGVMHEGRLLQWDTPYNLYHQPNSRFVADFIGQGVFLPGTVTAPNAVETEIGVCQSPRTYSWSPGTRVEVLLRPDDVVPDAASTLRAEVVKRAFKGAEILYTLRLPGGRQVLSLFPSHADHAVGERIGIRLDAEHLVAFPAN
jgi:iron(III) transport system ATP-binding protein